MKDAGAIDYPAATVHALCRRLYDGGCPCAGTGRSCEGLQHVLCAGAGDVEKAAEMERARMASAKRDYRGL